MRWRRSQPSDQSYAMLWAVGAISALVLLPIVHFVSGALSPCPWKTLTGIPCFGCGVTRAMEALAQGQLGRALAFHPLATIAVGSGVPAGLAAPIWVRLRGPLPISSEQRWLRWVFPAALLANWIYLVARGG